MPAPTITALPAAPLRSQTPSTFTTTAEAFVDALVDLPTEINAWSSYLDGLGLSGTSWKGAVRVATTVAGTLATDFDNGSTVDGITLATGDRILIKNQAAGAENGIHIVAASGAPTRATDFDDASEILGAGVYVIAGTANGGSIWLNTNTSAVTVGSTALTFAEFTGSGYAPGGTDVALADGGTGASLSDPGADRILFWDDSAGAMTWLQLGTGLVIATTTLQNIETFQIALSDMTTALTTGDGKAGWVVPYDCTILEVFTALTAAQSSSGAVTIDARLGNTGSFATIFSAAPSIAASKDTNLETGGTAATLSTTAATKGQLILFDIDAAGTGAKGLIVTVSVRRT